MVTASLGTRNTSLPFAFCPAPASDHAFTVTAPSAMASATDALPRVFSGCRAAFRSFFCAPTARVVPLRDGVRALVEEGDRRFWAMGKACDRLRVKSYQTSLGLSRRRLAGTGTDGVF